MRAVDHRLLLIDGVPPEAVEYGSTLPPLVTVWIAARAGMRAVFERTTIAAIVDGQLPDVVLALAADVHAWDPPRSTRPLPSGHDEHDGEQRGADEHDGRARTARRGGS